MASRKTTVTMADVARKAGVSVASVSNYLNRRPYMSDSMRTRIAIAVDALGYQVNSAARNLRSGRTRLLKLSIPDLRQVYFSELSEDILAEARAHGYGVIVESTTNSRERELESIASMGNNVADGLIFSPLLMHGDDIDAFAGDYPLVLLGERLFSEDITHVVIQNRSAAAAATRHLLDTGSRRILVVGGNRDVGQEVSSRSIRTEGYRDALVQKQIAYDPSLICETVGWNSVDGVAAIASAVDNRLNFDAVFALNDRLAWGVLRGLRELGVRVPEQVRVVGFDNVDESVYMVPSLTSVDPGKRDIAYLAVESIMRQIKQGGRAPACRLQAPYTLVCRESSAHADSPPVRR